MIALRQEFSGKRTSVQTIIPGDINRRINIIIVTAVRCSHRNERSNIISISQWFKICVTTILPRKCSKSSKIHGVKMFN